MPRPRAAASAPRATYHHGNLRRALIDESLRVLAEVGPEAFTLREAARRVGVDHRAAYRHFADREALLAAVGVEGYSKLVAKMRAGLAGMAVGDAPARLRCLMRTCVLFAAEHPAYYRVMTGPRLNETGRFPELEPVIREAFALLQAEIESGVSEGELAPLDATDTTVALWALAHGIASLVLTRRVRVKPEKLGPYADKLVDRALHGIVSREPPKKPRRKLRKKA